MNWISVEDRLAIEESLNEYYEYIDYLEELRMNYDEGLDW